MDDQQLHAAALKIADFILEFSTGDLWMQDWRKEGVNPFYNQTQQGLFLEMYYGLPNSLWTPWGKWGFGGSGSGHWDNVHEQILQRLGATLHTPRESTSMGEFGPVYALHNTVDGQPLPEPIKRPRDQFLSYEDANAVWERLTKQQS